jgi:hypothetical protein
LPQAVIIMAVIARIIILFIRCLILITLW